MTRFSTHVAALVFTGFAGCAEAPTVLGSIDVPLTAPGPDGSVYHLPPTSRLVLSKVGFFDTISLQDDGPSLTVQAPPGTYSATMDHAGISDVWPLIRTAPNGTAITVPARLELPPIITVAANQTTSLVIRFHSGLAPITFSVGSIDISVEVDGDPGAALQIQIAAPSLEAVFVSVGDLAPPELASRLPTNGAVGGYLLTAETVGPWMLTRTDTVCAATIASPVVTGHPGFIQLVAEALTANGPRLCITQDHPGLAFVTADFPTRQGAALTPLLSDLPALRVQVRHTLLADVRANVLDGSTLRLDLVAGAHEITTRVDLHAEVPHEGGTRFDHWYSITERGEGTMSVGGVMAH
jgi:hypothetical protein